jgi:AraC-like DNA-binding protein
MLDHNAARRPALPLRPFIALYAGFTTQSRAGETHTGLPSRHVHVIIGLTRPIEVVRMPSAQQRPAAFTALVGGLHDTPTLVRNTGSCAGMHLFLTPLGVRSLVGVPSAALAGRVVDLFDVWKPAAGELIERVMLATTWEQCFAILDEIFVRVLRPVSPPPAIAGSWRILTRAHGCLSIRELAREVGWSRRHLTERFNAELGVTPKTAARILRFERACRTIMDERPKLADTALICGYQDQAHMTREWRALAGCTPKAWIARELPFLQDYEVAGADDGVTA